MENASKALIIAGAILLSILIIGAGIAVFTSAQDTINNSGDAMAEQEVNAFNSKFTEYQGEEISGSSVKSLLSILASNYGSYKDEKSKLPSVNVKNLKDSAGAAVNNITNVTSNDANNYTKKVGNIRNVIVPKHTYKVTMNFGETGLINEIVIEDVTK